MLKINAASLIHSREVMGSALVPTIGYYEHFLGFALLPK